MSRARHHMEHDKKAEGGKVEPGLHPKAYDAQGSEVEKEADEKKRGGRAKRKDGGRMHHEGGMKAKRLDRPGRKRGGRVGADKMPLTGANKITDASEHDAKDSGDAEDGP